MPLVGGFAGPYRLGERLGAGAMGAVYASELPDGLPVAIKLLHPHRLGDSSALRKFRDEGIAGLIVSHPNVVSVLDRGETPDGIPFLVMTRVDGESLAIRMLRDGLPSLRRGVAIVQQVLAGLDALHAAGVVHGDVKTDNIIVQSHRGGRDTAVLIDLGLATPWLAGDADGLQERTLISGTPEYMAPELIRGARPTPATDIYAAGVTLYELVTGALPFSGGSPVEIIQRQIQDEPMPPSLLDPATAVSPMLERIVLRALDKRAPLRFPTAGAFAFALGGVLEALGRDEPPGRWARGSRSIPRQDLQDPETAAPDSSRRRTLQYPGAWRTRGRN